MNSRLEQYSKIQKETPVALVSYLKHRVGFGTFILESASVTPTASNVQLLAKIGFDFLQSNGSFGYLNFVSGQTLKLYPLNLPSPRVFEGPGDLVAEVYVMDTGVLNEFKFNFGYRRIPTNELF